jgi:thiamine kinase
VNIPPEVLARIPGCEGGQLPCGVVPLPGGEGRNLVLRIETTAGRFVWRRRMPPVDRPGSLARTELLAHQLAAAAGFAPRVLAHAPDASWMLMEHVAAEPWSERDLQSDAGVERLGTRLAALHALAAADMPVADAPAMAHGYVALACRRDAAAVPRLQPLVDQVATITAQIGAIGPARVLVHGDLMVSNLLGPRPWLVDWEYAQAADPSWDIACLLSYYPFLEGRLEQLLQSAGQEGRAARELLVLQRQRFSLLHRLWNAAYPTFT